MSDAKCIFLSRPTTIGDSFEAPYSQFHGFLEEEGYAIRRLGAGEAYSKKAPLMAVINLVQECCGAIILGYPQLELHHETRRNATVRDGFRYVFPTPWNQIEGALAYANGCPTLVVAHPGIDGGIFDHGITGEMVLHVDLAEEGWFMKPDFVYPFREWAQEVAACDASKSS